MANFQEKLRCIHKTKGRVMPATFKLTITYEHNIFDKELNLYILCSRPNEITCK